MAAAQPTTEPGSLFVPGSREARAVEVLGKLGYSYFARAAAGDGTRATIALRTFQKLYNDYPGVSQRLLSLEPTIPTRLVVDGVYGSHSRVALAYTMVVPAAGPAAQAVQTIPRSAREIPRWFPTMDATVRSASFRSVDRDSVAASEVGELGAHLYSVMQGFIETGGYVAPPDIVKRPGTSTGSKPRPGTGTEPLSPVPTLPVAPTAGVPSWAWVVLGAGALLGGAYLFYEFVWRRR
jgi:hypothetical protein